MHMERRTVAALLLSTLLTATLAGCGTRQESIARPDSPYCLRGGSVESFSCDAQEPADTAPTHQALRQDAEPENGNVTDDALYAELARIKSWLSSEKVEHADNTDSRDESDIVLPPPVAPQQERMPEPPPPLPTLLADAPYRQTLYEAQLLYREGFPQHAQSELMQLIALYPDRPEAYNNLGVMLAESGQYSEAINQLQKALATHPHYARIHANLRSLYAELAGNTYSNALGVRRKRPAPQLETLDSSLDAADARAITAQIADALEAWARSQALETQQRAALYIPGFRPSNKTNHAQWLQSLAQPAAALQLQAYELAIMTSDWVEVTLQAGPVPPEEGDSVQRVLSLIRIDSDWLISAEQPFH